MGVLLQKARVAFQGEPGAFSEAAAIQLLGEKITPVPRPTFDATFRAIAECAADALLVPVENSLAGAVGGRFWPLPQGPPPLFCGDLFPHRTPPLLPPPALPFPHPPPPAPSPG